MSVPTNTLQTYQTIGIREDLEDIIYLASPTETPFLNLLDRGPAMQTFHEWQTQALRAAAANAQIEGDDASNSEAVPTVRLGNYTQIMSSVPAVSRTNVAVRSAGRSDEMSYQIALNGQELRRDMEFGLVGVNQAYNAGSASTARKLASYDAWIATNVSKASDGANPTTIGSTARTDGTQRAFTEDMLQSVLQQCYSSGGNPGILMVGPFNKRVVSGFAGNATRYVDAMPGKLQTSIDVYQSDFSTISVVPNRFQRERDALVIDQKFWGIAFLRPMSIYDLAVTGDAIRKQIVAEFTLTARNPVSSGIIADLTTS